MEYHKELMQSICRWAGIYHHENMEHSLPQCQNVITIAQNRIEVMPEERKNAAFYEKHGFQIMEDGVAMQLCNFSNQFW